MTFALKSVMRDIMCFRNAKYELARGLSARLTSEPLGLFLWGFGGAQGDGKRGTASVWHRVTGTKQEKKNLNKYKETFVKLKKQ